MIDYFFSKKSRIILSLLLGIMLFIAAFAFTQKADGAAQIKRLNDLQKQAASLSLKLSEISGVDANNAIIPPAPIKVAQSSRNLATINVKISELEEQIRILTGQVEGLQFQMTQLQTFLERQQEDYEFRFQQLEGGGLGKIDAAPSQQVKQPVNEVSLNQNELSATNLTNDNFDNLSDEQLAKGLDLSPPEQEISLTSKPLDLSVANVEIVTKEDADAQYMAGFEAVQRGDYQFAREQFSQFIELFPTHPQAPDATNWLGEALILSGEYQKAADILLNGFQSYSASKRAPDLLLNLGRALAGVGEHATACRTFAEITKRYKNISDETKLRLNEEISKEKC